MSATHRAPGKGPTSPDERVYRFGPFTLDVPNRQLWRDGAELAVRSRAFDVLALLVGRAGRLVTKDDLLDSVWSELAVEENNIQVQVSSLRRLLGQGWIVTVPGRGYRFSRDAVASGTGETSGAPSEPDIHDIPQPATPLVGRRADVAAVTGQLRRERLVTIVGPGGIGKTRVAQEVARAWPASRDGCAWIDLGAIPDPDIVAEGIATALGLAIAGAGDAGRTLVEALRGRDTLLVFDNAEHVLEALAPLLTRLLARSKDLRLLVTSQAPCRVAGEHVHRLTPLSIPAEGDSAGAAAASDAVALFVARARALVGDFRLEDHNAAAVVSVCRHLDGIPLALELAAGRLPGLGLAALADRLEQRFRVLTTGHRAAPDRQRTLEALFDWSYGLLDPGEQQVFRRLGLLAPTFTLDQAVPVCAGEGQDEWSVVETLGDLVDRSLAFVDSGEAPRYSLLESGRAYARARLDPATDGPAIVRAIRLGRERGTAAATRSENAEALRACAAALELVALMAPGPERDAIELDLCLAVGPVIQATIGPAHPRAESVYRRAAELATTSPDAGRRFAARWGLWQFLGMSGRDREAAAESDALVGLATGLQDPGLELEAWHARMTTMQLLGRAAEVVSNAERVVALYDRERHHALTFRFGGHDPCVCALGQGSVGQWLIEHPTAAAELAQRAMELGASLGHAYSQGAGLFYAAFTWQMLGDRARFSETSEMLFDLCRRHAMDMLSNEALLLRGRARWETGLPDGVADMERAVDTIDAGGDYAFALYYVCLLAEALIESGRPEDASRRLARAAEYALGGQRFFMPEVRRWIGELQARGGHRDDATRAFREARELALEDGATALARRAAASEARWGGGAAI